MAIKFIDCPQYRHEVLESFKILADRKLQMREWLSDTALHLYYDSLRFYVLDTIFNDFDLDKVERAINGGMFYDEEEAKIVNKFAVFLDEMTYYDNKPDKFYLNNPEWPEVWDGAAKMVEMMEANDKKYNFDECFSIYIKCGYDEWLERVEYENLKYDEKD